MLDCLLEMKLVFEIVKDLEKGSELAYLVTLMEYSSASMMVLVQVVQKEQWMELLLGKYLVEN